MVYTPPKTNKTMEIQPIFEEVPPIRKCRCSIVIPYGSDRYVLRKALYLQSYSGPGIRPSILFDREESGFLGILVCRERDGNCAGGALCTTFTASQGGIFAWKNVFFWCFDGNPGFNMMFSEKKRYRECYFLELGGGYRHIYIRNFHAITQRRNFHVGE